MADLTKRIQNAGTEVVEAKAGGGSATLSMGQAAARFGLSLVRALQGEKDVVECAYVEGDGQYARFFSQPLLLGKNGVEERKSIGKLSAFEQNALEGMLDTLKKISPWAKSSLTSKRFCAGRIRRVCVAVRPGDNAGWRCKHLIWPTS